jgi:hypothetical protein
MRRPQISIANYVEDEDGDGECMLRPVVVVLGKRGQG